MKKILFVIWPLATLYVLPLHAAKIVRPSCDVYTQDLAENPDLSDLLKTKGYQPKELEPDQADLLKKGDLVLKTSGFKKNNNHCRVRLDLKELASTALRRIKRNKYSPYPVLESVPAQYKKIAKVTRSARKGSCIEAVRKTALRLPRCINSENSSATQTSYDFATEPYSWKKDFWSAPLANGSTLRAVLFGSNFIPAFRRTLLTKTLLDGTIDETWGIHGRIEIRGTGGYTFVNRAFLRKDGSFLAAYEDCIREGSPDYGYCTYNLTSITKDGRIDRSFGTNGVQVLWESSIASRTWFLEKPDGRIEIVQEIYHTRTRTERRSYTIWPD